MRVSNSMKVSRPMKATSATNAARKLTKLENDQSLRPPKVQSRYETTQEAPFVAEELRRRAPMAAAFKRGREEVLREVRKVLKLRLGVHGSKRTPLPKLRAAIGRLGESLKALT